MMSCTQLWHTSSNEQFMRVHTSCLTFQLGSMGSNTFPWWCPQSRMPGSDSISAPSKTLAVPRTRSSWLSWLLLLSTWLLQLQVLVNTSESLLSLTSKSKREIVIIYEITAKMCKGRCQATLFSDRRCCMLLTSCKGRAWVGRSSPKLVFLGRVFDPVLLQYFLDQVFDQVLLIKISGSSF